MRGYARAVRMHQPFFLEVEGDDLLVCGHCGESEASHVTGVFDNDRDDEDSNEE